MKKSRRRTLLAVLLTVVLLLPGCGGSKKTAYKNENAYTNETVYGTVTEVADDTVTVKLGTLKEGSETEVTEGDETLTVTIYDSTDITYAAGGGAGASGDGQMGTPPDKPDGANGSASGDGQMGTPPDKPDGANDNASGDGQMGTPPDKPDGANNNASGDGQKPDDANTLQTGDTISITFDEHGVASAIKVLKSQNGGGPGGAPGGSSNADISYEAVKNVTGEETISDEISSTGTDESAVLVSGDGNATISGATITRNSSDSTGGDNSSFYGVGAALLATGGTMKVTDTDITTDAAGGAGIFAYGDSKVTVSDTTITTKQDTSGGIHVAGGGTLTADRVTATTNGVSSAAIRSDRGGGTIKVTGGSYTSNGVNSPAIYSTANISATDAKLKATNSEAVCIEGKNNVSLKNCTLSGAMQDNEQNDCTWNIILYQSMSGDSEEGNSVFEAEGGSITANNGGMFYTTNTESTITLKDVAFTYAKDAPFFLRCTGNQNQRGWGKAGENGADLTFTGISQEMEGDVIYDSISTLDFYLTSGSTLTGAIYQDESCAGNGGDKEATVTIDESSTWVVTKDSVVTNLNSLGKIVDENGNNVTIKGTDGTVYVKGSSDVTVTVTNYSQTADLSGANTL